MRSLFAHIEIFFAPIKKLKSEYFLGLESFKTRARGRRIKNKRIKDYGKQEMKKLPCGSRSPIRKRDSANGLSARRSSLPAYLFFLCLLYFSLHLAVSARCCAVDFS